MLVVMAYSWGWRALRCAGSGMARRPAGPRWAGGGCEIVLRVVGLGSGGRRGGEVADAELPGLHRLRRVLARGGEPERRGALDEPGEVPLGDVLGRTPVRDRLRGPRQLAGFGQRTVGAGSAEVEDQLVE